MFNYPATRDYVTRNRARLLKYEQLCTDCRQWYEVPLAALIADLEYKPPPGQIGKPFVDCFCPCGSRQHIICPGKYDSHRSKRPTMQRYAFTTDAARRVRCSGCNALVDSSTAHRHDGKWIGEECWDERLRTTE